MNIRYSLPLSQAYQRMKKALFQPFDISKWLRVGFTAWLAGLTDCQGSSGNSPGKTTNTDWKEFFNFPETAWNWLIEHPLYSNLILIGFVLLAIVITVMIWLSARGKFMFLHNVVNDAQEVSKPWHEYKKEGNSLFVFEFIFGWTAFLVFAFIVVVAFLEGKEIYYHSGTEIAIFWAVSKLILLFLLYLISFGYISLLLKDFVVPLMYKHRIGILHAWGMFLKLFAQKFYWFILYGLFIFVLGIAVVVGIIFVALLSCCIGFLLIAIPYIGSVILLPVSYTFRAFSIQFLAQFGPEFNVLEDEVLPVIGEQME